MKGIALYPLRFEPIYQYRLWGGRRLGAVLSAPLPGDGPIGEAWVLSDRDEHPSMVSDGPFKGRTIRQLLQLSPERMLGELSRKFTRFPMLLKFLDVTRGLSVQVHPSDADQNLIPSGDTGKDEAWVVLSTGPEARIYAGLKADSNAHDLRQAIADGTVPGQLISFVPKSGDSVYIPAGTVHSLRDVVVFEVQENSDVTFRLYDWNHIDPSTGQPRPLQTDQAIACIDFKQGAMGPVTPAVEQTAPALRETLIRSAHFGVMRIIADVPFVVGEAGAPRVLVCIEGSGQIEHAGGRYPFHQGDVLLLAAEVGACACRPHGATSVLELSLPEAA